MNQRPNVERIALHQRLGEWPRPGAAELLERRLETSPTHLFLVDGEQRITFGEFGTRVERLASALRRLGIGPGDVVSWQLPSWWEAAVVAVAIDHVGAISNPILPIYREAEVCFIAKQAGTRMLIVPDLFRSFDYRELAANVRASVTTIEHVVIVRGEVGEQMYGFTSLLDGGSTGGGRVERDANAVALLVYTSGTTSDPKGVMHTHSTMGSFVWMNFQVTGSGPRDVGLLQFPLTHIGGLAAFVMLPLLVGSRVVYLDRWDPERALSLIESEAVTGAGGPPAILQGLLRAEGFDPARVRSVRTAGTGAADVSPQLIREVRQRFAAVSYRAYGLTECPMLTTGTPTDPEEKCMHTDGRPAPGCSVRIVDDGGNAVGSGFEGEIEAFGPQLCVGYLDAGLAGAAFTSDGYLRTGDIGIIDDDGYVRVTGRKKDIILRKGENLSAKAIEDVLHAHPSIAEAAVIGVPDPEAGERVCACLVMRPGAAPLALEEIRHFMVQRHVMSQKIPEQLEVLSELPRNATGKILKHRLRAAVGELAPVRGFRRSDGRRWTK